MKFALVEFEEENSIDIVETKYIVDVEEEDCSNEKWDFHESVEIIWPSSKSKEAFEGRIVRFSDDQQLLKRLMKLIVDDNVSIEDAVKEVDENGHGRGKRKKIAKRFSNDESSDDEIPVVNEKKKLKMKNDYKKDSENTRSLNLLKAIKERESKNSRSAVSSDTTCSSDGGSENQDTEVVDLRKENQNLKKRIAELEAQLLALNELPSIVKQLKTIISSPTLQQPQPPLPQGVPAQSSSSTIKLNQGSQMQTIQAETPLKNHTENENTAILTEEIIRRARKVDARKFTNDLLTSLYSNLYMATHSVTGINSVGKSENAKPPLDSGIVKEIEDVVTNQFPDKTPFDVRHYMREKLNDCSKMLRRSVAEKKKDSQTSDL